VVAALSPQHALDYLGELSTDILAGAVLDSSGACVAGDAGLARTARDLLGDAGDRVVEAPGVGGRVFAARGRTHSLAVLTGRFALPALVRHDIDRALEHLVSPAL
jgi:cystathionine beta-lyase family protein involved in aluminum resistance